MTEARSPLYLGAPVVVVHLADGTNHDGVPMTACNGTPFWPAQKGRNEHVPRVPCTACTRPAPTDDQAALDRAAADMAVRDDLAREVARAWRAHLTTPDDGPDATARLIRAWDALGDALDRLAAAYGEDR